MIGAILSMRYVGKQSWKKSIVFWVVYFVVMAIVSALISQLGIIAGMPGIIISATAFVCLAHYWPEYKFDWFRALKVYALALIIDVILLLLVVGIIIATIGLPTIAGTAQYFV